jgi:hypothetical protein
LRCGDGTPFKGKFWASGKCKHCGESKECHTSGSWVEDLESKEQACDFQPVSEKKRGSNKENSRKRSRENTDIDDDVDAAGPGSAKKKCGEAMRYTDQAFASAAKSLAGQNKKECPTPVAWTKIDIDKTCAGAGVAKLPTPPPPPPLPRPDPLTAQKLVRDGIEKLKQAACEITETRLASFFLKHDASKLVGPCAGESVFCRLALSERTRSHRHTRSY